jgi:chromosomal replication initiator protein
MAVYLIRELTNLSTTSIGKELGKDHTTILYSCDKIKYALQAGDVNLQNHVRDITANINSCL